MVTGQGLHVYLSDHLDELAKGGAVERSGPWFRWKAVISCSASAGWMRPAFGNGRFNIEATVGCCGWWPRRWKSARQPVRPGAYCCPIAVRPTCSTPIRVPRTSSSPTATRTEGSLRVVERREARPDAAINLPAADRPAAAAARHRNQRQRQQLPHGRSQTPDNPGGHPAGAPVPPVTGIFRSPARIRRILPFLGAVWPNSQTIKEQRDPFQRRLIPVVMDDAAGCRPPGGTPSPMAHRSLDPQFTVDEVADSPEKQSRRRGVGREPLKGLQLAVRQDPSRSTTAARYSGSWVSARPAGPGARPPRRRRSRSSVEVASVEVASIVWPRLTARRVHSVPITTVVDRGVSPDPMASPAPPARFLRPRLASAVSSARPSPGSSAPTPGCVRPRP